MSYDSAFFDSIRKGCQESAAAVVPLIVEDYEPSSVVDVGCGEGWWGNEFREAGCDVIGLDDGEVEDAPIVIDRLDLAQPFDDRGTADLAVCLEVAEHLSPERAEGFVADLCRLAPIIVFSAAIPGQGGTGHLNEQWPDYWAGLFAGRGFFPSTDLRRHIWDDERVKWWYRQNILVFSTDPHGSTRRGRRRRTAGLSVVHPEMLRHHGLA